MTPQTELDRPQTPPPHTAPPHAAPSHIRPDAKPEDGRAPQQDGPPATRMAVGPLLSVVVPCYNEEQSLPETLRRLLCACETVCGEDFEIILVDDGSRDMTWPMIARMARDVPQVVAIRLARNHGHQLALSAGLDLARGARIFIIDADLQDPPELLGPMMARMDQGVDVVYGRRVARRGETAFKRGTAAGFYRLLNHMVDVPIPADTGDFRLMSRRALDHLLSMPERHRFIRGMVAWIGLRQEPFDYIREERFAGQTHYPLRKMLSLAIDAITGFSVKPLRMASYLGLVAAAGAVILLAYTLISWAFFTTVSGWASVMMTMLFIGAAQLLVLGVIGEYLGRMFMEAKGRPLYIIDHVERFPAASEPLVAAERRGRLTPQGHAEWQAGAAPRPEARPEDPKATPSAEMAAGSHSA
ncbi:glycosyltransferase family 2 protein (plasmid) [Thioclava litoralis]|uniref:Glycosyltransferase family 2 protein n=2 Tax=Thioclava litoralis TaxID=3076557 RepID=A0ABZ1E6N4_9RHOB|nr:glycosyltransferase family 2 protein [Thioclava sp. FTW29]